VRTIDHSKFEDELIRSRSIAAKLSRTKSEFFLKQIEEATAECQLATLPGTWTALSLPPMDDQPLKRVSGIGQSGAVDVQGERIDVVQSRFGFETPP
jgi:hypothetical protein